METPLPFSDELLQMWVRVANRSPGSSLPMMLNTPGCTVVGALCSGRKYFDGVASDFRRMIASQGEEGGVILEGTMKRMGDIYDYSDSEDDYPAEEEDTVYLHVADATVFIAGGMRTKVNFWRGRIDQVTGFSFGLSGSMQFTPSGQP